MTDKIGALVRTSLVDFPGRICATIFLKHCNLKCPYCYNGPLVFGQDNDDFVTLDELKNHLSKRKNVLSGLVISGGEALLNPDLEKIITFAKSLDYKIKLDTNGTLPDKLQHLLETPELKPDFVAMDIKTTPSKYHDLLNPRCIPDPLNYEEALIKSINLLSRLEPENREFRTVLVPELIKEEDIKNIGCLLPKDASWQFAQFRNENCLEPLYNAMTPYTDVEITNLLKIARSFIPGAQIR